MHNIFYIFVIYCTRLLYLIISLCAILALSPKVLAGNNVMPIGRYCGLVFHKGTQRDFVINFIKNQDGHISGTMHYNDDGVITNGTIEEIGTYSSMMLERKIGWHDKYGSGFALFKFNTNFDQFSGQWWRIDQEPKYPWSGQRCEEPTS